ncbi:hypothetical protein QTI24_26625 [Variovorax sp. J22P240]|uniref:hypothetical protein n=1 Tax=Variovorax sp. J22P240 TaxID=3053514 RepID=UPI00257841EF|nr:hypothetical protein [Variovorax sp. J22P240]MDM0002208.1 hypothetical protein [Variovorax sp. J22P240]
MTGAEVAAWWAQASVSISDVIAVGALLVAAWSAWRTATYAKVQDKLNKALLAEQEERAVVSKRARISLGFDGVRGLGIHKLVFLNDGQASARKVRLAESSDGYILKKKYADKLLPYPILRPGAKFEISATIAEEEHTKLFMFKVQWEDDYSLNNEETFHLAR